MMLPKHKGPLDAAQPIDIAVLGQGNLQGLPRLPPRARIEAVFLVLDRTGDQPRTRMPPVELTSLSINGDIISTTAGNFAIWPRFEPDVVVAGQYEPQSVGVETVFSAVVLVPP